MKIYLGSDHAGFRLKEFLKKYFDRTKIKYEDLGSFTDKVKSDYPDYAVKVARKVVRNKSRGILICGTGTGMVMAANKIKGARASLVYDIYSAKMARHDNDANILCLRGRNFSFSKARNLVKIWLKEKFSNIKRHKRRINKINRL